MNLMVKRRMKNRSINFEAQNLRLEVKYNQKIEHVTLSGNESYKVEEFGSEMNLCLQR